MFDNPRHAPSTTVECLDKTEHSFSFSPSSIGGEGHYLRNFSDAIR